MKNLAMHIWELPQTVLSFFIWLVFAQKGRHYKRRYRGITVYSVTGISGVSLGRRAFLNERYFHDRGILAHEYGHSRQSAMLGPLYLLIVGLPSFGHNHLWRSRWYGTRDYYDLYPERWADRLGGVDNRGRWASSARNRFAYTIAAANDGAPSLQLQRLSDRSWAWHIRYFDDERQRRMTKRSVTYETMDSAIEAVEREDVEWQEEQEVT